MNNAPLNLAVQPRPRRVLTDDATDAIREAILTGDLAPGTRLIEEELAASLKVSRGPVRQAFFRLQQEGLVVHETHRGAFVADVSAQDAEEIYSLRTALERLAVERACRFAAAEDFAALEALLESFRKTPSGRMTRKLAAELDIDFHHTLFRAARHQRLFAAWERMRSQIFLFLLLRDTMPADFRDHWVNNHRVLLDLVQSRDVAGAVRCIERHIGSAYQRLEQALRARDANRQSRATLDKAKRDRLR